MKKWGFRFLTALILLTGIGMMSYPLLSNILYERRQADLMQRYNDAIKNQNPETINRHLEECKKYNHDLLDGGVLLTDPFDDTQLDPDTMPYAGLLNILGDGVMGSVEYPGVIDPLMIYHGTREEVLQNGVGHLQGTSLPVGGTGTHCVLSAHSGLSGKKLFTNLDQARIGDVFYLHVIGQTLAYQVDAIHVVLPSETEHLMINAMQDYVTLITCTPYGINSHRLLVRGTRIPYDDAKQAEQNQRHASTWLLQYLRAVFIGVVAAAALGSCFAVIRMLFRRPKKH